MTSPVSPAFIETFNTRVKQQYQGMGKLRMCVRYHTDVVGKSHAFPVMQAGEANSRGAAHSDLVPLDGEVTLAVATMQDWNAPQFIDDFEQFRVNWSIQSEYQKKIAMAITRREDAIILEALGASGTTKTVPNNVSGAVANLTMDAIRRASKLLNDDEVEDMDRYMVISSSALEGLLGETEATSSDYQTVKALVNGDVDTIVGFKFKMIGGSRRVGGLPIDSNLDRTCYAFHKDAIGYAMAEEISTRVDYSASKGSWVVKANLSSGAVAIDPLGIVNVIVREAA